jgi:hypothetical protein
MNFASSVARSEFIGELSGPPWSPKRFALPWALFLAGVLGGRNAFAVGLDAIAEQSLLGEPLRVGPTRRWAAITLAHPLRVAS